MEVAVQTATSVAQTVEVDNGVRIELGGREFDEGQAACREQLVDEHVRPGRINVLSMYASGESPLMPYERLPR